MMVSGFIPSQVIVYTKIIFFIQRAYDKGPKKNERFMPDQTVLNSASCEHAQEVRRPADRQIAVSHLVAGYQPVHHPRIGWAWNRGRNRLRLRILFFFFYGNGQFQYDGFFFSLLGTIVHFAEFRKGPFPFAQNCVCVPPERHRFTRWKVPFGKRNDLSIDYLQADTIMYALMGGFCHEGCHHAFQKWPPPLWGTTLSVALVMAMVLSPVPQTHIHPKRRCSVPSTISLRARN